MGDNAEAGVKQEIDNQMQSIPKTVAHTTTRTLHVRYIVAGNPNTPKEVLAKLAHDVLPSVRQRVAENPRTPVSALMELARDPDPEVRLGVAENPGCPDELIEQLASDEADDVRYGVAENPHIPRQFLMKLAEDGNPYVACRAQKTLQLTSAFI